MERKIKAGLHFEQSDPAYENSNPIFHIFWIHPFNDSFFLLILPPLSSIIINKSIDDILDLDTLDYTWIISNRKKKVYQETVPKIIHMNPYNYKLNTEHKT